VLNTIFTPVNLYYSIIIAIQTGSHIFQPLVFKSLHGPQNASAISFIEELNHRISQHSDDDREIQFLFQRLRVIMQRYNAVLYVENFLAASDDPDHSTNQFLSLLLTLGISTIGEGG